MIVLPGTYQEKVFAINPRAVVAVRNDPDTPGCCIIEMFGGSRCFVACSLEEVVIRLSTV
jgi:uncharacterized protein YlzI (FlbEa/FlbD family)